MIARVCASRCVHACVIAAVQLEWCCVARVLWVAAAVAGSPCYALVRLVSCAVSHCCSVRADSDCNTVVEVLCVPPGVAALDAAAWCRWWVCDAAPPLCVTSVLTSTSSVQCSGVCSCGAACLGVCVYVTLRSPWAAVCGSERVLLCCCVAVLPCVALRFIGRSLRLSAAVVAQQRWRYAGV